MSTQIKLVKCDHCGNQVPITEARKTGWEVIKLYWYYCIRCETNVFGNKKQT
jgi:hypothetical protein